MLFAVSGLMGCPVVASDGEVGVVKDFLFDDETWKIRWMAVERRRLAGRPPAGVHPPVGNRSAGAAAKAQRSR